MRRSLPILCVAAGLAGMIPPAAAQQSDGASVPESELIERLDRIESKLDRVLEILDRRQSAVSGPQSSTDRAERALGQDQGGTAAGPVPAPIPVPDGPAGWDVTAYRVDPDKVTYRSRAAGRYTTDSADFTLAEYRQTGGLDADQPIGIEREAIFEARNEGWHEFGMTLTFPPRGAFGFLSGFVCRAEVKLNDEFLLEQVVRMPYGLGNRTKTYSGTKILRPGRYRVTQFVGCASDGRQSADPGSALDAIAVETLVKRPSDRRLRGAEVDDFRRPAGS